MNRLDRRIGGLHAGSAGYIYRLSAKGRRLLDLSGPSGGRRRTLSEPTVRFQDHVLAVAELATGLHEAERCDQLELLRFEAEPACWRRFTGLGGEALTLKPDAFVIAADGDYEHLSFVEVDLDTEGMATIRRKAEVYRRYAGSGREQTEHGVFPRVIFLARTEQRQRLLRSTLQACPTPVPCSRSATWRTRSPLWPEARRERPAAGHGARRRRRQPPAPTASSLGRLHRDQPAVLRSARLRPPADNSAWSRTSRHGWASW